MTEQQRPSDPFAEFFARVWSLDIACPGCGTFHVERTNRQLKSKASQALRVAWDPLTSHFVCRSCSAHFVIGVVAWLPPFGAMRMPPEDHLPKPWHLARLRELVGPGGFLMQPHARLKQREPANRVVSAPCSCVLAPKSVATRDPKCPVHSKRWQDEPTMARVKVHWRKKVPRVNGKFVSKQAAAGAAVAGPSATPIDGGTQGKTG